MSGFTSTDPQNHQSENTWFTPKELIEYLGVFDLDPCSVSYRPFNIATTHIERDLNQDGLKIKWKNKRVWVNPPYGKELKSFVEKFIDEKPKGFMLIFARTGNADFQNLIKEGAYVFLLRKRISFIDVNLLKLSNAGTDSCLVFWNKSETKHLKKLEGVLIKGNL